MKKLFIAIVLSISAFAVSAEGMRIAFVDGDKVVLESPQYQALQKQLESDFKRKDNELMAKKKQLEKLQAKLERDGVTMKDTERGRLERDIRKRTHALKSKLEEYRDEFNIKRGEARQKLQRVVREVIEQVGKAEGYDMILSAGVVFVSKKADITAKVLARLKRDYKSSK